MKEKKTEAS